VFLPFAAGYYLTYLFRTINALIANRLMADLGLGAADLGALTSVFFLSLAATQLPLGVLLDRYGPRRVQITLLPIAAFGATVFATADSFATLVIGRALIGVGVAGSLMSGLKAIILWFPRERAPLANGCFIMLGALGAVTATAPAESLLASIGWRGLFELLAIVSAGCALILYLVVPETWTLQNSGRRPEPIGLKSIYCDSRFWRLAPLSATCIGSAWALHGRRRGLPMLQASINPPSSSTCSSWLSRPASGRFCLGLPPIGFADGLGARKTSSPRSRRFS
jgi:MFS family permease